MPSFGFSRFYNPDEDSPMGTAEERRRLFKWTTIIAFILLGILIIVACGSMFLRFERRRPPVAHVDCARLIAGDRDYMEEVAENRPILIEQGDKLNMTCAAIKERILPARNPNTEFPILYARIVYTEYEFLEDQLITNYARENVYVFSIDKKSSPTFHEQFFSLERCLPNVIVSKIEHDIDSAGHNQNEAHLDCMKAARGRKWEYAVLMQNNDVLIKTHGEMTEILKIYGGANDVESSPCPDHRCIASLEKNLGKLELCPKDLGGDDLIKCMASDIHWGKGAMQAILSRAAVEFVLDKINVTPLMKEMNAMGYGVDEQLYNSIQITPEIRLPGGFHFKCIDEAQPIVRLTQHNPEYYGLTAIWMFIVRLFTGTDNECPSGMLRHSVCVFGVEDLPLLASSKDVMANKMLPDFDQAVTTCVSEMLFNRTREGPKIDRHFYQNINSVRYHHERNLPGFDIDKFTCKLS